MRRQLAVGLGVLVVAGALWLTPTASTSHPTPPNLKAEAVGGTLVVDLFDGATEADLAAASVVVGSPLRWLHALSVDEALAVGEVPDLAAAVAALERHPGVEVAEPAILQHTLGFPNDPLFEKQWHLREMGAPQGWANTPRGKGVIVAVIDTGVSVVEDLDGARVLKGASFVPGARTAADDNGHGTHVAGTIAQTTGNGLGAAGVAPEATILPVKVLSGSGSGQSQWIAAGIDYAVDEGAQVINLSLGGGYSKVIDVAVKKARARGVVVVAAAGNSGREGVSWPGALQETIGVGAVGPGGNPAPYSSWGKGVDLAAPGGDKRQAGGGVLQNTVDSAGRSIYAEFQGTSMATPHVAGAAAVLLSTGRCDADCVEGALIGSAAGQGWDPHLGHGRLDLGAALTAASRGAGDPFRAGLGLVFALALASRAPVKRGTFLAGAAFAGAWAAGGLPWVASVGALGGLGAWLGAPWLAWAGLWGGTAWAGVPFWVSATPALLFSYVAGAFHPTRGLALGAAVGMAVHFGFAAWDGGLEVWFVPTSWQSGWMLMNAAGCALIAFGLMGVERVVGRTA